MADLIPTLAKISKKKTRQTSSDYLFTSDMLTNTRLQNFLITIDNRKTFTLPFTNVSISNLMNHGINKLLSDENNLECVSYHELSTIIDTDNGSVEFTTNYILHDGYNYQVYFSKKYTAEVLNSNLDSKDNAYVMNANTIKYISGILPNIVIIYEHRGELVHEISYPGPIPNDEIDNIINTFTADMNNGELPPECEDKWTTASGEHSRCKKYCEVRDICPFYTR